MRPISMLPPIFGLLVVFGFIPAVTAGVNSLGVFGQVYSIAEPDALTLMEARAAGIDWRQKLDTPEIRQKINHYKPAGIPKLPRAVQDRTFRVDMTYTLEFDIPDGRGGILYPAGYTFNPLDYMTYPRTLVIIDAADPDQVEWLRKSEYLASADTRILMTDGVYAEVRPKLKRHVYFAMPRIIEQLNIRAVPAVARQTDNAMEVREIAVVKKKK